MTGNQSAWLCLAIIFVFVVELGCREKQTPLTTGERSNRTPTQPDSADVKPDFFIKFYQRREFLSDFQYINGENSEYFAIIEALGGGVAALDFDRDGFVDLAFAGGGDLLPGDQMQGKHTGLFRNLGDWHSVDVSHALPDSIVFSHGAAAADFDDDGFTDLLVTGYGGVQLFHNEGDATFSNVTLQSQIIDDSWCTSAGWGDLNSDGIIDLYIVHYVNWSFQNNPVCTEKPENRRDTCPPRVFEGLTDSVFLGCGDGTFRSAHDELGFSPKGKGLGVLLFDMDGDGDLDVYVANDGEPNFVYQNDGGKFSDISITSGADRSDRGLPDGSMGLEIGDFNNDLRPDIWVTNFEKESMALYRSSTGGFFQHVSRPMGIAGIGLDYVGWGICLADFDGDGDEDVFIATGHANRQSPTSPRYQLPILLENVEGRRFVNVASHAEEYFTKGHLGRGVSGCDFNNDGRCDLAISQIFEPVAILENTTPIRSRWIGVKLVGRISTRDPIGARVTITTGGGRQSRYIKGGGSYLSTSDPRLLFHVPQTTEEVLMEIRWPSGITQTLRNPTTDQYVVIVEPEQKQ